MKTTLLVVVIGVLVIAGAVLLMRETSNNAAVSPTVTVSTSASPAASVSPASSASVSPTPAKSATIRYTESGFQPATITVAVGAKVTFVNESSGLMWVASGPHPQHTLYPEFDALKGYAPGTNYSFTFTKVGEWPFHNHLKASHFGKITVK